MKNFFSKCDQIRTKLRIWSHLLKKSLTENSFFEQFPIHSKQDSSLCGMQFLTLLNKVVITYFHIKAPSWISVIRVLGKNFREGRRGAKGNTPTYE